jgi:hypothetical protein
LFANTNEGQMNQSFKLIVISILTLGASSLFGQGAEPVTNMKSIVPFGRPRQVQFDAGTGKAYTYYTLAKGQSVGFGIDGPSKIQIRSRAGLKDTNMMAEYQVQVWDGEYLAHADKFTSKIANAKLTGTTLIPSTFKNSDFEAPAGTHNYRLWLVSDNVDTVFIRIYAERPPTTEPVKISMYPLEFNKMVHLYSKKNQTLYYLVDKTKGVKLKVAGPLELIVTARANFSINLDGRIGYSISVMEDSNEIDLLSATTSKSLTMAYQDFAGVVPSQPTDFILKVPAGNHLLNFILKESAANNVSIRFSLPKQEQAE